MRDTRSRTSLAAASISRLTLNSIINISSSSRVGRSNVIIEFNVNRDIDAAANDVRERVSRMMERLPDQARPPQVVKAKGDDDTIAWF